MNRIWQIVRGKPILTIVIAATAFAAVFAFAAGLGVSSDTLGAGGDTVESCDTTGVTVSYTTAYDPALAPVDTAGPPPVPALGGYKVTSVVINGVEAGCNGLGVKAVLTGALASKAVLGGEVTGTAATGTTTLPVATDIAASDVTGVYVVIAGTQIP